VIGVGCCAYRFELCLYLDHGDEVWAVVVVILEFDHELVFGIGLEDELVDCADDLLVAQLVIEEVDLPKMVDVHHSFQLEPLIPTFAGQFRGLDCAHNC
jgi:hypothetical protein